MRSPRPDRLAPLSPLFLLLCLALALFWPGVGSSADGQSLVVLVTDESGAPIPDALVIVRDDAGTGPTPQKTAEDGQATFELDSGEWQVDVQREGFMIYTGYVKLVPGKQPELGFSSRQRTGSFWAPLTVSFGGGGAEAVFAASKKEEKQAQKELARLRKERERERRLAQRGDLARVKDRERDEEKKAEKAEQARAEQERILAREQDREEDQDRAQASDLSSGEAEAKSPRERRRSRRGDSATVVRSAKDSTDEEQVAAKLDEPEIARDQAQPEAARNPTVESKASADRDVAAQPEASTAPAELSLLPNPHLLPAGACRECQPGEWAVSAFASAASSSEGCPMGVGRVLADAADAIEQSLVEAQRRFAGQLRSSDGNDLLRLLPAETRSKIENALSLLAPESAACPVLTVVLPAGARYVGYRYRASDDRGEGDCLGTETCQIGDAEWLSDPVIEKTSHVTLIYAQFENLSKKRERVAELRVYFVPPDGWLPPN